MDSRFGLTLVGATQIAKQILQALVEDLKLRPGDFVYEASLRIGFMIRGLTVEDLGAGLEYARQQEWLVFDPDLRVYTLTQAGYAVL